MSGGINSRFHRPRTFNRKKVSNMKAIVAIDVAKQLGEVDVCQKGCKDDHGPGLEHGFDALGRLTLGQAPGGGRNEQHQGLDAQGDEQQAGHEGRAGIERDFFQRVAPEIKGPDVEKDRKAQQKAAHH